MHTSAERTISISTHGEAAARSSVSVAVHADCAVIAEGLRSWVTRGSGLQLAQMDCARVVVLAPEDVDSLNAPPLSDLAAVGDDVRLVTILGTIDMAALMSTGLRFHGVLKRDSLTETTLRNAILQAASGSRSLSADLALDLLAVIQDGGRTDAMGRNRIDLTDRETAVVRLLSEGFDTQQVARTLSFSTRTIKNVIHAAMTRHGLRNRTHLVAHAVHHGVVSPSDAGDQESSELVAR